MGVRLRLLFVTLLALLALPASAMARDTWLRVAADGPQPPSRSDHALAPSGNKATILFGGRSEKRGVLNDTWRLDLERGRWARVRTTGAVPAPRFGHNLVGLPDGDVLLFGGEGNAGFFADTWRLDVQTRRWRRVSTRGPKARYGAAGALDPATGRLVVSHGFTDNGRFDDTWGVGRGAARNLSGARPRPLKRCLVQGTILGGDFFLFGGQSDPAPFRDDLWRYDLATRRWTELQPDRRPSARNRYAAASAGPFWLLQGGLTAKGSAGDLWRFDPRDGQFTQLETIGTGPGGRYGHAAATAPRGIVVFGGNGPKGQDSQTWRLLAPTT